MLAALAVEMEVQLFARLACLLASLGRIAFGLLLFGAGVLAAGAGEATILALVDMALNTERAPEDTRPRQ